MSKAEKEVYERFKELEQEKAAAEKEEGGRKRRQSPRRSRRVLCAFVHLERSNCPWRSIE